MNNKDQFIADLSYVCDLALKAAGLNAKNVVDRLQESINNLFKDDKKEEKKEDKK